MNKKLLLEDGSEFYGQSFGHMEDAFGQVVFVTSMTGYQELLTDPSLVDKIVVMTYPLIGNYGINRDDYEALQPYLSGLVVRDYAKDPCNFRMNKNLSDYLKKMKVSGLFGLDTRRLTRHIRDHGTMGGAIIDGDICPSEGLARLADYRYEENPLAKISTQNIYQIPASGRRAVLIDYGTKASIVRNLSERGYHLTLVPYFTGVSDILDLNPDVVILAGGSGNPNDFSDQVQKVKDLLGRVPIFGISMGQYLLALASGAQVDKLKFGHYGQEAVRDLATGKILTTYRSHHYSVNPASLAGTDLEMTYQSVNNQTVQGIRHKKYPAFAVQFQPEGSVDGPIIFDQLSQLGGR